MYSNGFYYLTLYHIFSQFPQQEIKHKGDSVLTPNSVTRTHAITTDI